MSRFITTLTLVAACITGGLSQDQWKNIYTETAWSARDQWQRAEELISRLNLKPGSSVADLGCHEGYMTFKLSRVVGHKGRVYAVDLDMSRLEKLKVHRDALQINNITVIQGSTDNPKLSSDPLDAVLIVDTYHELKEHDKILQHIRSSLKPGGRLVICEAIADHRRKSLRQEQEAKHEIGMNFVAEDLENTGFKILNSKDPFVDRTKEKGDKMWLIVAVRK